MIDLIERLFNYNRATAAYDMIEAAKYIETLEAALNYVADMTYCGTDAEWHFKPGYDPQRVLDAITDHIDWDVLAERRLDQSSPPPLQASQNSAECLRNSDAAVGGGETEALSEVKK